MKKEYPITKYEGIEVLDYQTGFMAKIGMEAYKEIYKEGMDSNDLTKILTSKIRYSFARQKAQEFGEDISEFPNKLNYLELKN